MRIKKITNGILTCFICVLCFVSLSIAGAEETKGPILTYTFDTYTAVKVQEIKSLPIDKAFKRLQARDFRNSSGLLYPTIFNAFKQRKKRTITYAVELLRLPLTEEINGRQLSRYEDFYIAKKIFEVFPEDAVDDLLQLYETSDAMTKGNIICAVGKVAAGHAIRNLLIEALDDKTFYENPEESIDGPPLRICDIAYDQLVLRYKIKKVLRTIGNALRIEVRDYHINILKEELELLF